MDERGYLTITGRLKEMIVTGGVNVYPSEIEAVLAEHPAVAQVAVLGVPDARWGEAVVAVVRCAPGCVADAKALEAFSRERLASYKVPKRWHFADELPVTASGKVQKHLLLQQLLAGLGMTAHLSRGLRAAAARFGEQTALLIEDRRLTFGELDAACDAFAGYLAGRGVGAGQRVAVMTANRPEFVVAVHGHQPPRQPPRF